MAPPDAGRLARNLKPFGSPRRIELLEYVTQPRYLEEIAKHLGIARQAVLKHLRVLQAAGLVMRTAGQRRFGPVVEYVLVPERLFAISEEFSKLGSLRPHGVPRSRTEEASASKERDGTTPGPSLVLVHGRDLGKVFPLRAGEDPWAIGRSPDQAVCLDYDPFVSNRHAEVQLVRGEHVLVDGYATNGSSVNWSRLPRGGRAPLRPGAVVGVGKSLLVFQA